MKKNIEIVPAILSKTRQDLEEKAKLMEDAPILQIDLMDNKFVPNETVGTESLGNLPKEKIIEYHLMVKNPLEWIEKLPDGKNSIFQVHIETLSDETNAKKIIELAKKKKSKLCWVLNPDTKISAVEKYMEGVDELLVMCVHPGFSNQKYISEMEGKIRELRKKYPHIFIEVDGGINEHTMLGAIRAGANRIAAASAIFGKADAKMAYRELKRGANELH